MVDQFGSIQSHFNTWQMRTVQTVQLDRRALEEEDHRPAKDMLERRRLREIERSARRLVRATGIKAPPVDPAQIARHLGVSVQKADLGPECSGVLVRKGPAAVIGVHWAHHPNRQRFTIAHELGHYHLHAGGRYIDADMTVRDRQGSTSAADGEEREAHAFAGALLMPRGWLRAAFLARPLGAGDDTALAALASLFQVSTQAMSIRLAGLGWLRM